LINSLISKALREHESAHDEPQTRALLDIGCNEGDFLSNIKNGFAFQELIGLDIDAEVLGEACKQLCQVTTFDLNQLKTAHAWYLKTKK
jgi:trans-aconitate methyltransferase